MQIQCPSCKRQYTIDGSKVTEQGVKIICPACKHQFIMRRKGDDKPQKPEPPAQPQRKTPPCAVCGQPSTHVFRGPPPRPLCEVHYKIEGEKESRFFETDADPGATRMTAPAPDPGRTTVAAPARPAPPPPPVRDPGRTAAGVPPPPPQHSSGRTQAGGSAPARPAAPPQVSEPSFDDFDDFDFSDLDSSGSKPGTSRPGTSLSGISSPGNSLSGFSDAGLTRPPAPARPPAKPPAQPAAQPAAKPPAEESIVASNFEFMDDLAAANAPPPADSDPGESDPFRPEPADDPFRPGSAPSKSSGQTRPAVDRDDSIPDFTPDPGENEDSDFAAPQKPQFNLDGSAAPEAPAEEEDEFNFGWEDKAKKSSRLEEEIETTKPKAPVAPAVRPATRAEYEAARLVKPRSSATAIAAALILLFAVLGAGFISLSGQASQTPNPAGAPESPAATWEGRLQAAGQAYTPDSMALPTLTIDTQGQEAAAANAEDNANRAMQQALRDTAAGYDAALVSIAAALASEPGNGRYQALKVEILAFREALAAGGQPEKAGASAQALAEANGDDPLLIRAKAHVFVNDRKTAAATALLNNYMAQNPQDGIAVFLLAMATKYQPEPDRAAATRFLEQAVALEPGLARGYWELASLYREQGQFKAAIDVYNRILTTFPDHAGTAEAMEETLREQKGGGATGDIAITTPAITIIPQAAPQPEGIAATGNVISETILDAIGDVEPRLRRVVPNPDAPALPGPGGQTGQPQQPRPPPPKPPEEAQ